MSTKSYPRIEELGLAVSQRGFWITAESKRPDCSVNADELEALLESAGTVYAGESMRIDTWTHTKPEDVTHSARLIAIAPIVKESAGDVLGIPEVPKQIEGTAASDWFRELHDWAVEVRQALIEKNKERE